MLNTIHEEFDLKSKLKDLQNKKIKIKISKKDGMKDSQIIRQALGESQISHKYVIELYNLKSESNASA
jgi:hypothetical protein